MSCPSKPLSDKWQQIYPLTDIATALRFMQSTWNNLVAQFPDLVHPGLKEQVITQNFGAHLQSGSAAGGLSGVFQYELPMSVLDPVTGKRIQQSYSDISYIDTAFRFPTGRHLSLIFEFKKLNVTHKSRYAYTGKAGMEKFIGGRYARHAKSLGFMVGLVHADADSAINKLKKRLRHGKWRAYLHIVPDETGEFVRKPSAKFAELVSFETFHSRRENGPLSELTICHFFLGFEV